MYAQSNPYADWEIVYADEQSALGRSVVATKGPGRPAVETSDRYRTVPVNP